MIPFEVHVPFPTFHQKVCRYAPHDYLDKMQPLQEKMVLGHNLGHIRHMILIINTS